MKTICSCGNEVEEERVELLDSKICSECARKAPVEIEMAHTVYNADGTTELVMMNQKNWQAFDRAVRARSNMHGGC